MNIVFATSDLYSRPAVVTIQSLLMNNQDVDNLHIYYIENEISESNKNIISRLVLKYNRQIEFIKMPDELRHISGLMRTNVITYSYCFFQDILPIDVEKVLLIESDTLVLRDLTSLYETSIDDYYVAAADDHQSRYCKEKVGIRATSPYFNAGVLLINLKKLREDNISKKIKKIIQDGKSKFMYEVQDELNVCYEGMVKVLPPVYNCTTSIFLFSYNNMIRYRWPSTKCSRSDFDEAKTDPFIVHFTKNQIIQSRPWMEGCNHPYKKKYDEIKKLTEVSNDPLWKSDRKGMNKAVYFIYSKISQTIIASTLGFVHAYLYPKILYRHMLLGG